MKNEERARQLRQALETAERSGAGQPYPEPLRRAAVGYHREREREGASVRQVAAELGVSDTALLRWSRRREPEEVFRAIEVVAEPVQRRGAVVVHGPRGLRIEGLTVEELAGLIERLS